MPARKQRASRGRDALRWLADNPGATMTQAADRFGIRAPTLYQARASARARAATSATSQRSEPVMPDPVTSPRTKDTEDTTVYRCKITLGRLIEMRLLTSNFTAADVERIRAFLATIIDDE